MKRNMALVAVAAIAVLAFAALPSMASAFTTTPTLTLNGSNGNFTSSGGAASLISPGNATVNCTAQTNKGKFETNMTGTVTITFTGCTESVLGTKCKSTGAANGTIVTEVLPFHLVYGKPKSVSLPHETPAILFTSNVTSGRFASFACASGLVSVVVTGNGVLGMVNSPKIGETSSSMSLEVNATEAGQEVTQTQEGETFGLKSSVNGGTATPAFENAGKDTVTLGEGTAQFTTTPSITLNGSNGNFTSAGGAASLISPGNATVNCTGQTDKGRFIATMAGNVTITFTGCEGPFGNKCKSTGAANGTIVTEVLPFHLVYGKQKSVSLPHETPAILFTSNVTSGRFASFACESGLVSVVVTGNGVLGMVNSPKIGETSSSMSLEVNATEAGQEVTQTQEGETSGLKSSVNGGPATAAFENAGKDTVTLENGTSTTNTDTLTEGTATTNTGP